MGLEALGFLGLFSGIASTAINASLTSEMNEKQFKQQKDLMRYQDELNANRWQQQFNQIAGYNEPANQLQRLEKAGINPLFDSQFGGQTAASIQANTSLPGYSPSAPQVDLISGISKLAENLFNAQNLKLEDRKVKALEEKTGADIKNQTDATLSQCAVNLQTIQNMMKQNEKTDADMKKIATDIEATKQSLLQNWEQIRYKGEEIAQGWKKLGIEDYTSKWQEQVARMNNSIGWFDANTRRQNVDIAQGALDFSKEKFNKEYAQDVKRFSLELRKGNLEFFEKAVDLSSIKLFGANYTSPKDIAKAMSLTTAVVNNMSDMSNETFTKVAPGAVKLMQGLSRVSTFHFTKLDSQKKWKPQWMDASDGW